MAAVVVALYDDYATAERVRTELVSDGFPTDRVELTSLREPGQAGSIPGDSLAKKLEQYFRTIFAQDAEGRRARFLADRLCHGAAAITVHPRGDLETHRTFEILERHQPADLASQGLDDQAFERAATEKSSTVVERVLGGDNRPLISRTRC